MDRTQKHTGRRRDYVKKKAKRALGLVTRKTDRTSDKSQRTAASVFGNSADFHRMEIKW